MKKLLISALVIGSCMVLEAQYNPMASHFMYDNLRTNPGSAGSMDMVSVTGLVRQQMVEFPGNPDNFFFEAEAPFKLGETKHGVGLSLYRDGIGFNTDINASINYAFRFAINDGTLGIGINAGFLDNSLAAEWVAQEQSDAGIPTSDGADNPVLSLGAGLFYRTEEIYFGASVLNINQPEVSYSSTDAGISEANYNLSMHYYVTAGYNMQLPNPAWELKPAVLLKSDARSTDMDLNLTCVYNKKFWAGVTYRTGEAVVGMIGLELIEGLKVGYSYDVQTSALANHSQGSHEILLNYSFKLDRDKEPQKYKSIRFL
ncbi:MAG: type IX secretion system membrane protein PorP/SprF [Bacteroidales bacterium]|nr:type IX secretion system membrane protein PorP/SprF [Bacteroidales bacterium]